MFRKSLIGAVVIATAVLAAPAAQARPSDSAHLTLTISTALRPHADATLSCGPDGGTHPNAEIACAQLTGVDGDLSALNVSPDMMCTMQYDPVQVTATGDWFGAPVTFERTYGNPCVLVTTTGSVFAI